MAAFRGLFSKAVVVFLWGVIFLAVAARVWTGFDSELPDHHAYLLPAFQCVAILGVAAIALFCNWLVEQFPKKATHIAAGASIVCLLMAGFQIAHNAPQRFIDRDSYQADDVAAWQLDGLPDEATVFISYFQTSFRLAAVLLSEGRRPDLTFVDRSLLTYPGAIENAVARNPDLTELLQSGIAASETAPLHILEKLVKSSSLWFELHPNLEPDLLDHLSPQGAFAEYASFWTEEERDETASIHDDALAKLAKLLPLSRGKSFVNPQTIFTRVWYRTTGLDFYCTVGRAIEAQKQLDAALAIAPNDVSLLQMAEDCDLERPQAQ